MNQTLPKVLEVHIVTPAWIGLCHFSTGSPLSLFDFRAHQHGQSVAIKVAITVIDTQITRLALHTLALASTEWSRTLLYTVGFACVTGQRALSQSQSQ